MKDKSKIKDKIYNDDGFLVDENGTHGLAGSLHCPCHDRECYECCPCKKFSDCKKCVEYYKTHETPDQIFINKIKNETLDEVIVLIEDLGWAAAGWGHVVNMINEKIRKEEKYYPATEEEMNMIRHTCFHPDGRACDSPLVCEYYDTKHYACKFNTKELIKTITSRKECNGVKHD